MEWFTFFRGHPFPSHHPCRLNYGHPSRLNCGHPCHLDCGPPSRLIRGHPFPLELELGLELGLEQVLVVHFRTLGFDHTVEAPPHNKWYQGCNHYWYIQTQSHLNCGRPFPLELELGLEQVQVESTHCQYMEKSQDHNNGYQGCNHQGYTQLELGLEQVQVESTYFQYMEKSQDHNKGYPRSSQTGYTLKCHKLT